LYNLRCLEYGPLGRGFGFTGPGTELS
jgi:hypothetical protein